MADEVILSEIKAFAAGRGFSFSSRSERELTDLFKLDKLRGLAVAERLPIYAHVFNLVPKFIGIRETTPQGWVILNELDVRDSARAFSERLQREEIKDLPPNVIEAVRDACPWC